MHIEVLSSEQVDLLPFVKLFKKEFYLVGGTAIALQLGHRMSVDFDLFANVLKPKRVLNVFKQEGFEPIVTRRVSEQLNLVLNDVTFTFFEYPYDVVANIETEIFRMPDLVTLAAMKAFALGRRSKWKDYVDLYFLLRDIVSREAIEEKATQIFKEEFSPKLFRAQLAYHEDVDYAEEVEYMSGWEMAAEEIREGLVEKALEGVLG